MDTDRRPCAQSPASSPKFLSRFCKIWLSVLGASLLSVVLVSSIATGDQPSSNAEATAKTSDGSFLLAQASTKDSTSSNKKINLGEEKYCTLCETKENVTEMVPWLKLGADFRYRIIIDNARNLRKKETGHDRFWHRFRARVWGTATVAKDLEVNFGLVTEPRYYCREDRRHQFIRHEGIFYRLNVKASNILDQPISAKVGRQDIRLGEGWLVLEGTPSDGGRTIHFDAIRITGEHKESKTTVDLIYIDNHANSSAFIRPFNDRDLNLAEQDEQGAIFYLTNKSLPHKQIDGYFIYKRDHGKVASSGTNGELYTLGGLIKGDIDDNWKYYVELAGQTGHTSGKNVCALAGNSKLNYHFNDPMKNVARLFYEYISGSSDPDQDFDRLWGRYGQWGETSGALSAIEGKAENNGNMHRVGAGWTVEPTKKVKILADYHLMFADHNRSTATASGLSNGGKFRGQQVTAVVKYKHNEHVNTRLVGEIFFPGDYYNKTRNDIATVVLYELVLSW